MYRQVDYVVPTYAHTALSQGAFLAGLSQWLLAVAALALVCPLA